MNQKKKIEIKCKGADLLPFEALMQFQGDLKKLSKTNLEKLKTQILTKGFISPFFIWKNKDSYFILDGTQRDKALKSLQKDGYGIPLLPVVYIEADNKQDAREKLLAISSQYGEFDEDELSSWLKDIDEDIAETLRIVDEEINVMELEKMNEFKKDEFTELIDKFKDKSDSKCNKDGNWFYVELYGKDEKYKQLYKILENKMRSKHMIQEDWFFNFIKEHAGEIQK